MALHEVIADVISKTHPRDDLASAIAAAIESKFTVTVKTSSYLPRCDLGILEYGKSLCLVDGMANKIEDWVVELRRLSKQRVDWHFAGGRGVVKYIGDRDAVVAAMTECPWNGGKVML